jgi:hypothetical protein
MQVQSDELAKEQAQTKGQSGANDQLAGESVAVGGE